MKVKNNLNTVIEKLLCQYEPCKKLGNLMQIINSCMNRLFTFIKVQYKKKKNYME
jgi:hypothetical protein